MVGIATNWTKARVTEIGDSVTGWIVERGLKSRLKSARVQVTLGLLALLLVILLLIIYCNCHMHPSVIFNFEE